LGWPARDAKHIRHAAFSGVQDNLAGSSASVLTGGPIAFGTKGVALLLDLDVYLPARHAPR
jgi:hypothetical protein